MTNAFYSAKEFEFASPTGQPINAASARMFDRAL